MSRVLLTAFEPFGDWQSNASWQLVVELTKNLPPTPEVVTRLYPVEFSELARKLEEDLAGEFDYAIHLGQNQNAATLELERFALNVGVERDTGSREFPLVEHGPAAYASPLPLEDLANGMRRIGAPARVSYHAGVYCCNAVYYHCQHLCRQNGLPTQAVFIHVPVTPQQAAEAEGFHGPSLDSTRGSAAMRYLLDQLAAKGPRPRV